MSSFSSNSIQPIEGILNATSKIERSAQEIASGKLDADQIIRLIQARREVEANVAVAKTQQDATDSLLNLLA